MKSLSFLLLSSHFLAVSIAVYKQWIPNTNFENASNWDKDRIPCANDVVLFKNNKVISVFVQSTHSLKDMYLPLNGEFIMASGAGFEAFDGSLDPGCDTGSEVTFTDAEEYKWHDPALWHAAFSLEDLEQGKYLFSVDEERVPCQHDDVIFQPETSFRVNIDSSEQMIHLQSISIMGQKFASNEALAEYMQSSSAKLQFHGNGTFQVMNDRCADKSGCDCGNAEEHQQICAALLGDSGDRCPALECKNPLQPVGHCCTICGATISLEYTPQFDIGQYRNRLLHAFLTLPKYAGVQMAISKVQKGQSFLGLVPRGSVPVIQIVLIDDKAGSRMGTNAEQLAEDIMSDIAEHGASFGIVIDNVQEAISSTLVGHSVDGRTIVEVVFGLLLGLLVFGVTVLLCRKGTIRLPSIRLAMLQNRMGNQESVEEPGDKGFDNPMFDTPTSKMELSDACSAEEVMKEMPNKDSGVYFLNPLYDETEISTD
ncbi:protein amnionless [Alligator mississippiensis]|uniref:Protein amnionless n=1 Tax=Alligator mississippiensis TaxID=8496 RepID=A0A151P8P0_ALLMI|nr:protein amnionless [Alligator mississippiensis]KYO45393.1 protein amnionless [Alligator mississippiensis]